MATKKETAVVTDKDVRISHFFKADRGLVWRFWSEPDLMALWWGPNGFTAPIVKIDLKVGGKYMLVMRSPEGKDFRNIGNYNEVKEPEHMEMTVSFADEKGNVVPASYYGMGENFPLVMILSVDFTEENGGTRLILHYKGSSVLDESYRKGMTEGWNEQFDKLEAELKKFIASC